MNKKIVEKSIYILMLVLLLNVSVCFAKTNSYIVEEEYRFQVGEEIPQNAYVKIHIGDLNVSQYSKGTINVTPFPNEVLEDDYGNKILKYNHSTLAIYRGREFKVNIEKNIQTNDNQTFNIEQTNINMLTQYLVPSNRIESDNPYIIAKTEEITKDCTTDYEKAEKIFEFVNMYLTYDTSSTYRNKGALSAMLSGRGVCEEYATLFCAMCRTIGIPARVVTGYNAEKVILSEKTDTIDIYHAWPEIYLEDKGWIPLEITAEYYVNGNKQVYWNGFLKLPDPTDYVVEGIYNSDINDIEWIGIDIEEYSKYITLTDEMYFTDIKEHWAKSNIENLYNKQIIKGYEDNTFMPDNNVTRAEYITMLSRVVEHLKYECFDIEQIYYPQDFEDNWVKESYDKLMKYYAFYAQDINEEYGAGYKTINYVFGEMFDMNKPILREEVVALLAPFLRYAENDNVPLTDIEESKFKKEIIVSYMNNIIVGYEDNTFRPDQTITRAEIATIFDRIINKEK